MCAWMASHQLRSSGRQAGAVGLFAGRRPAAPVRPLCAAGGRGDGAASRAEPLLPYGRGQGPPSQAQRRGRGRGPEGRGLARPAGTAAPRPPTPPPQTSGSDDGDDAAAARRDGGRETSTRDPGGRGGGPRPGAAGGRRGPPHSDWGSAPPRAGRGGVTEEAAVSRASRTLVPPGHADSQGWWRPQSPPPADWQPQRQQQQPGRQWEDRRPDPQQQFEELERAVGSGAVARWSAKDLTQAMQQVVTHKKRVRRDAEGPFDDRERRVVAALADALLPKMAGMRDLDIRDALTPLYACAQGKSWPPLLVAAVTERLEAEGCRMLLEQGNSFSYGNLFWTLSAAAEQAASPEAAAAAETEAEAEAEAERRAAAAFVARATRAGGLCDAMARVIKDPKLRAAACLRGQPPGFSMDGQAASLSLLTCAKVPQLGARDPALLSALLSELLAAPSLDDQDLSRGAAHSPNPQDLCNALSAISELCASHGWWPGAGPLAQFERRIVRSLHVERHKFTTQALGNMTYALGQLAASRNFGGSASWLSGSASPAGGVNRRGYALAAASSASGSSEEGEEEGAGEALYAPSTALLRALLPLAAGRLEGEAFASFGSDRRRGGAEESDAGGGRAAYGAAPPASLAQLVSNSLYGFARLALSSATGDAIATEHAPAVQQLTAAARTLGFTRFTPQGLCNVAWALARLGQADGPTMCALCDAVADGGAMERGDGVSWSSLLGALSVAHHLDERVLRLAERALLGQPSGGLLPQTPALACAAMLSAHATLSVAPSHALLTGLLERVDEGVQSGAAVNNTDQAVSALHALAMMPGEQLAQHTAAAQRLLDWSLRQAQAQAKPRSAGGRAGVRYVLTLPERQQLLQVHAEAQRLKLPAGALRLPTDVHEECMASAFGRMGGIQQEADGATSFQRQLHETLLSLAAEPLAEQTTGPANPHRIRLTSIPQMEFVLASCAPGAGGDAPVDAAPAAAAAGAAAAGGRGRKRVASAGQEQAAEAVDFPMLVDFVAEVEWTPPPARPTSGSEGAGSGRARGRPRRVKTRVAIEADGPQHFLASHPQRSGGRTQMRNRFLDCAFGGRYAVVPYFEWGPLGRDAAARHAYLLSKIEGALLAGIGKGEARA